MSLLFNSITIQRTDSERGRQTQCDGTASILEALWSLTHNRTVIGGRRRLQARVSGMLISVTAQRQAWLRSTSLIPVRSRQLT